MDPSSSTQHTEPTPNHNSMDPVLYNAVKNGDVVYLDQHSDLFDYQVTPNHNTVLHVAALFRKSESVDKVLEKKPNLIRRVNKNNENPLHIAIREQHQDIVEALIKRAEELDQDPESGGGTLLQMVMATNEDGDTPLHLAVREGDNRIVILLLDKYKAFQHLQYTHNACQRPNNAGETPLFLAAERNNGASTVESILASESPDYRGPSGKTALHGAVTSRNIESIRKLLNRNMELIYKVDIEGWTPLHYAAAAGHEDVMEEILSHCPDCWEMVTSKRQNILHIAVDSKAECVIDYITEMDMLASLMNQKDNEGNTPLHLLASSGMNMNGLVNHPRANMYAVNKQNKSPAEIAMSIEENSSWFLKPRAWRNISSNEERKAKMTGDFLMEPERKEVKPKKKASQSHMLVATLIATITIAASFTIPGGYEISKRPDGMAVLMRQPGFIAFILANTIAVMCSTSAVLCYVFAALYDDDDKKVSCYIQGFYLVLVAIVAMMVGFLSNDYAMVVHSHLAIKITTSFIVGAWCLFQLKELISFFKALKAEKDA